MSNTQRACEYLLLIKKLVNKKIKSAEHQSIKDDVVHEVFIKLFKNGFMEKFDMKQDSVAEITSYIYKTVHTCYMDVLKKLGFNVRLSAQEAEQTGNKYVNIVNIGFEDVTLSDTRLHIEESPEGYAFHKQAYIWIENCFKSSLTSVKDIGRAKFFYAAFWEFEEYALNLKELALHLGYKSSNPTQELSRFVAKVTLCTSPHGIEIVNPGDQVQFIREQLIKHEAIHE